MSALIRKIRSSEYLMNMGRLVRGNAIGQLILLLALPVLTRIYSPEAFGVMSVFVAFSGFAVIGLSLRYESAILVADEGELPPLLRLSLASITFLSSALTVLLYVLIRYNILGHGVLPTSSCYFMLVVLFGMGLFNLSRSLCLREGKAALLAQSRIYKSLANAGTKLALGLSGFGPLGLLAGECAAAWFATLRIMREGFWKLFRQPVTASEFKFTRKKFSKFPRYELPSSLLNQLAIALPVPMIAAIGDARAAGFYGVARMIVAVPNSQIGNAVADSFQWRVGELVRAGEVGKIRPLMRSTMLNLLLFGFLPYLGIALLSPWAFPFVLGAEWEPAGIYASIISVWLYLALAIGSITRLLSVIQRQELKLFYDVFLLAALMGVFYVAQEHGFSNYHFVAAVAACASIAYMVFAFILFRAARKLEIQ